MDPRLLPLLFLVCTLGIAVIVDIRSRRIPNLLVLAGWLVAIGWHLLGPPGRWSFDALQPGAVGILGAVGGGLVLLLLFLPFYALGFMGAGDVKLLSFVGCLFGGTLEHWKQLLGVALAVLIAGGVLAVVRMLILRKSGEVLTNLKIIALCFAVGGFSRSSALLDLGKDTADRMPYALAIASGAVFYAIAGAW